MRILGVDYGEKRIGLAVCDEDERIAFEVGIIPAHEFFEKLPSIVMEREIQKIVIGLPLNMSGERTAKTEESLAFGKQIQELVPDIPCEFMDERLSSSMAQSLSGTSTGIDGLAAQIFLQNYLNKTNANKNKSESDTDTIGN